VFLSLVLLVLAITGIALNHSEAIDLNDHYVPAWISGLYLDAGVVTGLQESECIFFSVGGISMPIKLTWRLAPNVGQGEL